MPAAASVTRVGRLRASQAKAVVWLLGSVTPVGLPLASKVWVVAWLRPSVRVCGRPRASYWVVLLLAVLLSAFCQCVLVMWPALSRLSSMALPRLSVTELRRCAAS
jgi:hypothetical protein